MLTLPEWIVSPISLRRKFNLTLQNVTLDFNQSIEKEFQETLKFKFVVGIHSRCYPRKKHKFRDGWVRHQGRNLDSCRSSSQSSSDLSSPNETCYSFVRRALQKLSNSKTWDNPHQRCRPPWFLQSTVDSSVNEHSCSEMEAATTNIGLSASRNGVCGWRCEIGSKMDKHNNDKQDSLDSNENADDIPIELHDVDSEIYEISDLERRTSNEGLNKGSMSRASSSNLKDSSKKSQSAKQLQRLPSVDSSSSPNMGHKSKSLSDILNLFSINFLHSRKTSQDSTSGSSSSSVAKHSSSSSTDSKSRQGTLLSSLQNHNRNGIIRSKSSHFTLAKVEEDNEQSASQPSTASLASDMNKTVDKAHLQQRWSVTGCPGYGTKAFGQDGYLDGSGGFDGKTCSKVEGNSRRPRSLILEHSVHIPRTLSAEDHKNGNTILPDLDSCLSFYGISGTRFPSPPYTKAEHNIVPPENKNWTENCSSLSDEVSTAQTNDLTVVHQHDKDQKKETQNHTSNSQQSGDRHQNEQSVKSDVSPKCWPIYKSRVPWCFNIREKSHSNKQQVKDHQCTNLMENSLVKTVKPGKSVFNELPMPSDPAKNDLWRDLFFANIIKQIIDREHLFPFRSMPNLYKAESVHSSFEWRRPKPHGDTNTSVDSTISVPKKHYSIRRRLSQPSNLDMKSGFKLEPQWIKQAASINTNPRNGFQKRSFSADVCCPLLEASKSTEDGICPCSHAGGISDPSSRNRCCYARHRSCACNSLGEIKKGVIKHSLSAGDSALKSIPFNLHSVATIKVGNNKIIVKEDSLQSDTSIDSDDSVASVIRRDRIPSCEIASPAPQKDSTSGSLHGRFERLCSNCSKESSNHSDTSFDSEESCISVIAVVPPGNAQGVLSSEVDSGVTKDAINDDVTDTGDNRISDQRSQPISESCCLKAAESIEADVKAVPRLSNDDVSLSDKDDSNTDIDEHAESLSNVDEIQSVPSMKSSISWEKYLDACESLVLDSIFYVNVAYSDYSGCGEDVATDCLMPDQLFDYYDDTVSLKYFDSEMPMTAEMCWLEPTPSWKSSEDSLGEGEEGSDSNEDSLPPLNDNLSTLDDDDTLKLQIFDGPDATEEEELHKPPLAASPQGRLLEAAVDVANTLQSAVSVAVTSTEKRKVTLAALKNCEHFQCLTKESVGIVVTEQLVPTLEMDHSIQDASKNRLEVHKIYADAESYNDVPFPEILESIASDFPMDPPLEFQGRCFESFQTL